jgi:hypothetical protein
VDELYTMPGPEPSDTDAMVMSTRSYFLTVPEPVLVSGPILVTGESDDSAAVATPSQDTRPKLTQSMVLNMVSFMSLMRVSEENLYSLLTNFIARVDAKGGHSLVLSAFVDSGLDARIGAEIIGFTSQLEQR